MKTVLTNTKRFLAVVLAFAMVLLTIPETALVAFGSEVQRYAKVAEVDELGNPVLDGEGNPVYTYALDEAGDYVLVDGEYVPADDGIIVSNNALGDPATHTVTFASDSKAIVTVKKGSSTGEAISSTDSVAEGTSLWVSIDFEEGFGLDAAVENSNYQIGTAEAQAIPALDADNAFTIASVTDDVVITIASEARAVELSTDKAKNDDATGISDVVEIEMMDVDGNAVTGATQGEDLFFKVTLTDAAAAAAATMDTVIENAEAKVSGVTVSQAVVGQEGVYKIPGSKITGDITVTADVYLPMEVTITDGGTDSISSPASNPTYVAYGEDLIVTIKPRTFNGYVLVNASATLTNSAGTAGTPKTMKAGEEADTFVLKSDDIGGTTKSIAIEGTGVKQPLAVEFDLDSNLDFAETPESTVAYGGTSYEFTLKANPGYMMDNTSGGKLYAALEALTNAAAAEDLDAEGVTVYAINSNKTLATATSEDVYPIAFNYDSTNDTWTGTITANLASHDGFTTNLTIVVADVTEYATYEVGFDGGAAPSVVSEAVVTSANDADITSTAVAAATYQTPLKATITIGTGGDGETYVFNGISYKIGNGSYTSITKTGTTKYTLTEATSTEAMKLEVQIDGSLLKGDVSLLLDAVKIETASGTISGSNVSATKYSTNGTTFADYTATVDTLETNGKFYARATVDSGYEVTQDDVTIDGLADVTFSYNKNTRVVTVGGRVTGDATITIAPVQISPIVIEEDYSDGVITEIKYRTNASADEWTAWKNYTSSTTVRADEIDGDGVQLRLKVSSGYEVNAYLDGADLTLNEGTGADEGYLVSEAITTNLEKIKISAGYPSAQVAVINGDSANISKVNVTVDTAADNDAYYTNYAKANSTYAGVRKTAGTDGIYTVYPAGGNAAKSANLVISVTNAANYTPVLKVYEDLALETAHDDLLFGTDYTITGVNAAGTQRTYNIKKTVLNVDSEHPIRAIVFESQAPTGTVDLLYPQGKTAYDYTASVDGVQIDAASISAVDTATYDGWRFSSIPVGKKIVFTVTPITDNTLTEAFLYSPEAGKVKEKNQSLSVKADSFSYTVTVGEIRQELRITQLPVIEAKNITGDAVAAPTKDAKDTVVTNSSNKQQTIQKSYTKDMEVGYDYNIGMMVGGTDVTSSIDETYLMDGNTLVDTFDGAKFSIPANKSGKNLTVSVLYNEGVYTLYKVKAIPARTAIKVAGVSNKSVMEQEIGTKMTYAVTTTPASASMVGLKAEIFKSYTVDEETWDISTTPVDDGASVNYAGFNEKKLIVSTPKAIAGYDYVFIYRGDTLTNLSQVESVFALTTKASKVAGAVPAVTQKGTASNSLILNLALPSAVSSNTYKNLADHVALIYEVSWTKKTSNGGALKAGPQYILATGANQTETIQVLSDAANAVLADESFEVTAKLYELPGHDPAKTARDDLKNEIDAAAAAETLISGGKSAAKIFATKATRYPSKLSVKQLVKTIYAGQTYEAGDLLLAEISADAATTYQTAAGYTVTDLSTATGPAAVVSDPTTLIFMGADNTGTKLGVNVIEKDGKYYLAVPSASIGDLNALLANARLTGSSFNYELKIVAPRATNGQEVSTVVKMTLEQKAVYTYTAGAYDENNPNVSNVYNDLGTAGTYLNKKYVELQKKSGTALTYTPAVMYDTTSTKAALNAWTWAVSGQTGISGIVPDAKTGKITIPKDFAFGSTGKASLVLTATSKTNAAAVLTWNISLSDSASAKGQGELVLGVWADDGNSVQVIARKGDKMTIGDLESDLAALVGSSYASNPVLQLVLLTPGAVIDKNGKVFKHYVVDDTTITGASSNAKIAEVENVAAAVDTKGYPVVSLTGNAVGNVTFTATPENTGSKKTVAVNFITAPITNTATTKDYFTIEQGSFVSTVWTPTAYASNRNWSTYGTDAAKKPTLVVDTTNNVIELMVKKGVVNLTSGSATSGTTPQELDDYYTASVLTAGTGVKVLQSDVLGGWYQLSMYGKTGTVRVNGVTYTLTDAAKKTDAAGTISQSTALYGDYNYAYYDGTSDPEATYVSNKLVAGATHAIVTFDNTNPASEEFFNRYIKTIDYEDPATWKIAITGTGSIGISPQTGKTYFVLPFTGYDEANGDTFTKGNYDLFVTFTDGTNNLTAPQKFTVKVTQAPAVTPVANYSFTLDGLTTKTLTLADKSGNGIAVLGFSNVTNTRDGSSNDFVASMIAGGFDPDAAAAKAGEVTLNTDAALIASGADARAGYVEYTTDGGVTSKWAKVTLSFAAGASFYKEILDPIVTAIASTWSAQFVTSQKVLELIKTAAPLPSNLTMTMGDFVYTPVATGEAATITGVLNIKNNKDRSDADVLPIELTIDTVSVSAGVQNYGLAASGSLFDYTITDGASKKYTGTSTDGTVAVMNGAALTITKIYPATGTTPDSYYLLYEEEDQGNTYKKPVDLKKATGPWNMGIVSTADTTNSLTIVAESLVTLSKGANINSLEIAYIVPTEYAVDSSATSTTEDQDTNSGKYYVLTGKADGVTIAANPKAGYDVVLVNNADKTNPIAATATQAGNADKVTFTDQTVSKATTYAATVSNHVFAVTMDLTGVDGTIYKNDQADGVYTYYTYLDKTVKPNVWKNVPATGKVNVPYLDTLQVKLTKKAGVVVSKTTAGAYDVTVMQSPVGVATETYRGTETKDLTTVTTKKVEGTTTLTFEAKENFGVSLTNSANPAASVSGMKFKSGNDAQVTYTSKAVKVIPDGTAYSFEYTVKNGYEATVYDKDENIVPVSLKTGTTNTYVINGTATETQSFTIVTAKTTEVGGVSLGLGAVEGAVTAASYTTVPVSAVDDPEAAEILTNSVSSYAKIGDTIRITAATAAGYDLQIQTQTPAQAASNTWTTVKGTKATEALNKLVYQEADAGVRNWIYKVKAADNICAIRLNPVAQARTFQVTNNSKTLLTNVKYQVGTDAAKTAGTAKITTYFGASVKMTFEAPNAQYIPVVKVDGENQICTSQVLSSGKVQYSFTVSPVTATAATGTNVDLKITLQ